MGNLGEIMGEDNQQTVYNTGFNRVAARVLCIWCSGTRNINQWTKICCAKCGVGFCHPATGRLCWWLHVRNNGPPVVKRLQKWAQYLYSILVVWLCIKLIIRLLMCKPIDWFSKKNCSRMSGTQEAFGRNVFRMLVGSERHFLPFCVSFGIYLACPTYTLYVCIGGVSWDILIGKCKLWWLSEDTRTVGTRPNDFLWY